MTYNKFIWYGNTLELYEYAREPRPVARRTGRKREADADGANLQSGGKDSRKLSEERWRKREDNAWRAKLAFRRLVASNLGGTELPILLTLTYEENVTDIAVGYKDFRSFVQALRYKYGKDFKYISVPEFQKRGAVHFHALVWGFPSEVLLQERSTRTIAKLWRHGFIFMKATDGHERLSSYLAKYMSKAFIDRRLKNKKAYVASRNIERPVVGRHFSPVWPVVEIHVGDAAPVSDKTYPTRWLGECRRRIFKAPSQQE